jgi:hypothetical protein
MVSTFITLVSLLTPWINYILKLGVVCNNRYYQEMALASAELSPFIRLVIDFGPFVERRG